MKSEKNNNSGNCIITVLDANDLPSFNSDTSSTITNGNATNNSMSSSIVNHNRRQESNNSRNVLHRFLIFHRSDQSQT
jgi:hypothetical protein